MKIIINHFFMQVLAMWGAALVIPGLRITSVGGAFMAVAALAAVNATIWDAVLFLQIPDSFSAHALTVLVANGVLFWVLVKLLPGIEVNGLLPAIAGPIVFTVLSVFIRTYCVDVDWLEVLKMAFNWVRNVRDILMSSNGTR